ncbi:MAG: hypothetical protein Q9213_001663 [Squamulea squamosa]
MAPKPDGPTAPLSRKEAFLTRRQIEGMIADGNTIIIVDGKVLKVDPWLKYHPGGVKAIMHVVGRDATDEVNVLHSSEARQRMNAFQVGQIQGRWQNFLPPIQGGVFRHCSDQEQQLERFDVFMESDQDTASESTSAPDSPLFDPVDRSCIPRRRLQKTGRLRQRSSVSSMSSAESIEPLATKNSPKLSLLDARTQKEIDLDLHKYPPLDPVTQDDIVQRYRQLNEVIHAQGLYQCHYADYLIEVYRYALLIGLCLLFLRLGWYATSGLFLGLFWHQLVFTAHDAGHMGITHDFVYDTVIGVIVADFLGGLSLGWWKRSHNVHHIVTNSPEHDPDIEHVPFFAISHRFFESLRSTYHDRVLTYDCVAKFAIRYQHLLYYPLLMLGRFNLYVLSWEYLLRGMGPRKGPAWWHRWFEIVGNIFFWSWFGYGILYLTIPDARSRFIFVMVSHMVTGPLHVQITLSHFAMSTADLGIHESFPQKMLRTTMDVDCPEWLDFVHGGLQFQAIHHLFPRIPRHNLRKTQKLVQSFCNDVGIPYALYGFVEGNKHVVGRLADPTSELHSWEDTGPQLHPTGSCIGLPQRMLLKEGEGIDWGFSPVFDLIDSLASAPTVQTNEDLSPSPSPDKLSTPPDPPNQVQQNSYLGNFDRIWAFLGQPLDIQPPEVPPLPVDDPFGCGNEISKLHLAIGKEVHWRDEAEGGELADNEEGGNNLSLFGLTKTQRKKLRRKQRKASQAQAPLEIQPTSGSESESVEPRTPKRSPDRRAIIQQILQGPPKTPENGSLAANGAMTRPVLPIDIGAWPVANPRSTLRATAEQAALAAAAAKKERLIRKIKERFIDDRQFLTNVTMVPFTAADNTGTNEGIHVFIDASNIMIGFHDSLKLSRGFTLQTRIRRQPISFHNLSLILERGRPVSKRVLVGSDNFAAIQEAKLIGYETNILDRVHKARELTPRQKKYLSSSHHQNTASSGANGTSGGSGSETTAICAKEKWVEQAVDEILHLKILESVVDAKAPSTIVLATGDAAEAEYSQGFLRMVERALEKGWKVELVSFRKNTSGMYKRKEFRAKWKSKFVIVELDDFVEELLGFEE